MPELTLFQVFTHGLGGSASQFAPLLTSLINVAPCLAIDLPGCGLSDFAPSTPKAYTTHALAELLCVAIKRFRDTENEQRAILIGHSMGCSINALLASSTSPLKHLLQGPVTGMVAICPRGGAPTAAEIKDMRRLVWLPPPLFDLLRWYDRRGGLDSASVERVVGKDADIETRKLQLSYNEQSQSAVFLRIAGAGLGVEGMPGKDVWTGIKVPLFLVAGEVDTITPASEVDHITEWLTEAPSDDDAEPVLAGDTTPSPVPTTVGDTAVASKSTAGPPRTDSGSVIRDDQTSSKHASALKTTIFPNPSGHGLLYSTSTVRILSGMIENFLGHHIDERLDVGWQLHLLTTSGKWDVKNLQKWQKIDSCSDPIGGIFRAMKTMREVDEQHSPKEFAKRFSSAVLRDGVAMVIDISHESPVYYPKRLEEAGVEYHKFPTVSKYAPKADEIEHFISLVDRLRKSPKLQPSTQEDESEGRRRPTLGLHCHYGFNRSGFFIACYLVERMGYHLQDAIAEFEEKRPPGIKHDHFVNELYVRYAVKMERRGTIVGH